LILLVIFLVLLSCLFPPETLSPNSPQSQDADYSVGLDSGRPSGHSCSTGATLEERVRGETRREAKEFRRVWNI